MGLLTASSSSSSLSSAAAEREAVIVVMDANKEKGNVNAVEWALNNVVCPRDSVIVLGVLHEIGRRNYSCFPLNVGTTISGIWEKLEFSSGHGEVNPRELSEEIERKRQQYQRSLQPFYRQCKKNEVKLEVKLAAGYCPGKVTVDEAQNSNARWIVLDSHLKKHDVYIYGHVAVGCNVAVMKGKDFATLMPSKAPSNTKQSSRSNSLTTTPETLSCNSLLPETIQQQQGISPNSSPLTQETRHPPSPCWLPLSWRSGFPRAFAVAEVEEITDEFSDEHLIQDVDDFKVYQGIFQDVPVIINAFPENDERFWTILMILSRIRHRNIMNIFGHCCCGSGRFLLTDYPCMSTLESNLNDDDSARKLTWKARWDIAVEIGGSLRYLHEECGDGPIVHQSVSSSNVVLSHCSSAMLSNFLTAKLLNEESSADDRRSQSSKKQLSIDVHDYGVFLLELITGKSARLFADYADNQSLIDLVMPCIEEGSLTKVMDPRLMNTIDSWEVIQMAKAALLCLKKPNTDDSILSSPFTSFSISEVLAVVRGDQLAISKC